MKLICSSENILNPSLCPRGLLPVECSNVENSIWRIFGFSNNFFEKCSFLGMSRRWNGSIVYVFKNWRLLSSSWYPEIKNRISRYRVMEVQIQNFFDFRFFFLNKSRYSVAQTRYRIANIHWISYFFAKLELVAYPETKSKISSAKKYRFR